MQRRVGVSRVPDAAAQERAARVPPEQLVGAWVEVEGVGPGLVVDFQPVFNRIAYGNHFNNNDKETCSRQSPLPPPSPFMLTPN